MAPRKQPASGIVYSTQSGRMCPRCSQPLKSCTCANTAPPPGDGIVRLMRRTKGCKGKGVTMITGLDLPPGEMKKLAKKFKQKCGSGGSVKNGIIEIQGDHRDLLEQELRRLGCRGKRAGG
jgi:translation initiation factor 1